MHNNPIGIFDSGVGGLSILMSVRSLLPNETFIYLADQKNNPYGGRSVEEIRRLAREVVAFLLSKNVKLVIVACNTVSVNAIDDLRSEFNVPIVAVVPVVKTISEKSTTKKAVVLSTPATANSQYLYDLIEKFGGDCRIEVIGTSSLEHLVEEGIVSGKKAEEAVRSALEGISSEVDAIALGCTHYPFMTQTIKKVVGKRVAIYDSGGAIARRTRYILETEKMMASEKGKDLYYTTGNREKFDNVASELIGERVISEEVTL